MRGRIRITCGDNAPADTRVFLNDHEVQGLTAVNVRVEAAEFPRVVLEFEPEALEYDGPADLVQQLPKWPETPFAFQIAIGEATIRVEAPTEDALVEACKRAGIELEDAPVEEVA